jgi:hypothetical protein
MGKASALDIIGYPVPEAAVQQLMSERGATCVEELTGLLPQAGTWPFWKAITAALYVGDLGDSRAVAPLRALAKAATDPRVTVATEDAAKRIEARARAGGP